MKASASHCKQLKLVAKESTFAEITDHVGPSPKKPSVMLKSLVTQTILPTFPPITRKGNSSVGKDSKEQVTQNIVGNIDH